MRKGIIKSSKEIEILKEGGKILAGALVLVAKRASESYKNPVSTKELDLMAESYIREKGGTPSFLGYPSGEEGELYPASLCVSLNDEIVHGLPRKDRIIKEGDLVKLDLGVKYKGLFTDAAVTVGVGKISPIAQKLIEVTKKSLELGIEQIYPGSTLGNYGHAVERYASKNNLVVVTGLVGHGVGYAVHEAPQISNFGRPGKGLKIKKGMVLALEPMVNEGTSDIILGYDGFTFKTADGKLSAHFEHTVAVTENGCEIITTL